MIGTKRVLLVAAPALFLLVQAVPYGRDHGNPPVVREPRWASPDTRTLAKRACFDCHSNETVWPGYATVAPLSWLVRHDVAEGREELNFSDWTDGRREGERPGKIREEVEQGEMPPLAYRLMHPEARLDAGERKRLAEGLQATAAASSPTAR